MKNNRVSICDIDAFLFDFDGVLSDNMVYVSEDGKEWVICSRSDGLAFDALKKLQIPAHIISSETNSVVAARAKKLNVPFIQGTGDKSSILSNLVDEFSYNPSRIFYVGNDINDYKIMKHCGISACPSDSHEVIKSIATFKLSTRGGKGVIRELLENIFQLDLIKILYQKES